LQAAFTRLKRMVMAVEKLKAEVGNFTLDAGSYGRLLKSTSTQSFDSAICDDLNTSIALTEVELVLGSRALPALERLSLVSSFDSVLGLNLLELTRTDLRIKPKAAIITEAEIEAALDARKEARAAKDFATSDALRDDLIAKGVEVMDGDPLGWDWRIEV
jgi:cysteinyl-tRNA synthetase